MAFSRRFQIRWRLLVLSLVSLLGMSLILLLLMQLLSDKLIDEKRTQTRLLIDAALGSIRHYRDLERDGSLSLSEAQRLAMSSLSAATYGETGYFFIIDTQGRVLMHPVSPELVGRIMLESRDSDGKQFFKDFVDVAQAGGGWVDYRWPKPGSQQPSRKVSYVQLVERWQWVVGSGLYLDDTEREINAGVTRAIVIVAICYLVIVVISFLLYGWFMGQLRTLAMRDSLTSLYTRHYLYDAILLRLSDHDRAPGTTLAVAMLDLDHFKRVNDVHGHAVGDRVLRRVGPILRETLRKGDLAVRYGGEEFLLVMLCQSPEDARTIVQRIRALVHEQRFEGQHGPFTVTLSGGLAYREASESFDSVLKRADDNLYEAKAQGRDCLVS